VGEVAARDRTAVARLQALYAQVSTDALSAMMTMPMFRVMHPWGPDKGRQGTLQSEHATITEAFAALDAMSARMVRTGAPSNALELVVVDKDGNIVPRPRLQ
jgi:hypothetical protein